MNPRTLLALGLLGAVSAQVPQVTAGGENMRLQSSSVSGSGPFAVVLVMDDDNGNHSLQTSWRRWWHCQIDNLDPATQTTLDVSVRNAGYGDVILPCWSASRDSGKTWGAWTRVPTTATPRVSGSTHSFRLVVPASVTGIRLAKYFPFTVTDKNALLARIAGHPRARDVRSLGSSWQGRPIERIELTDGGVPDAGKRRVWIHAGVHPAETTSYFVVDGLLDFLLSGAPAAELLLDRLIFDVVPMANPDGVFAGNYRTNARSVEIESQWAAPYASPEREVIALRTEIERLMGTAQTPGGNPIEVLLNLHSSHNVAFPFHFEHVSNPSFSLTGNNSGVIPAVNAKEKAWIAAFRAASPLVARGTTLSSTLSAPARPFVESMMHDRWSIDPAWTGAPNALEEVMAITFEGTYGRAADGVRWNTPADYRAVGAELARALGTYFGVLPGGSVASYGSACGATLAGTVSPSALTLAVSGATPSSPLWAVFGVGRQTGPLLPGSVCPLRTELVITLGGVTNPAGGWSTSIALPATLPVLGVRCQAIVADLSQAPIAWGSSNGLDVLLVR